MLLLGKIVWAHISEGAFYDVSAHMAKEICDTGLYGHILRG